MITVTFPDYSSVPIYPSDEINLPNGDLIIYLTGKQAQAHKLLREDNQEQIRRTIEHVTNTLTKPKDNHG